MNIIPDDEIRERKWSCLMEMILKHIHERDMMDFLENLGIIALFQRFIEEGSGKDHIISVVKYINEKSNIEDRQRFLTWVNKNLPPKLEKEIMTLAEQWRSEGEVKGERIILKRLLEKRFGSVPTTYLEKIENADADSLLMIGDKIIEAKTLDDVFKTYH